jgi:hypothetical protein
LAKHVISAQKKNRGPMFQLPAQTDLQLLRGIPSTGLLTGKEEKLNTYVNSGLVKLTLCASVSAALAACGGGGGGSSGSASSPTPAATTQISGKAIDGYLAGAKVCLDDGSGACDTSQPTTTTDASGNYSLTAVGNVTGKTLDVVVTPTTTDTTNGNTTFGSTFTLSAVLQGGTTQNVTPLTSMVAAQMQTGLTFQQATTAVQAVIGSSVDPGADYVANADSKTASLASQVVSTMLGYAASGTLAPAAARNVLNAIVATGSPAAVTPAAVLAQANALATPIDASTALASPLYVTDDFLVNVSAFTTGQTSASPTVNIALRDAYTLSGSTLTIGQEQFSYPGGSWTPVSTVGVWDEDRDTGLGVNLFDGATGVYEMKGDGTWTGFLSNAQLYPAISLSSVGSSLTGTDPNTGIGYTLQYRQTDVSGQPLASAIPFYYSFAGQNPATALMQGVFASGTTEYFGNASYADDQLILPVDADTVQTSIYGSDTTADFGEGITLNGVAIADPNNLGTVGQTYTSVQQVIGMPLTVSNNPSTGGAGGTLVLAANGQFTITGLPVYATYPPAASSSTPPATSTTNVTGTWTAYARNPNVLVLSLPATFTQAIYSQDNVTEAIRDGAKFVIALQNGRLKSGFLIPAGTVSITPQFTAAVASQIATALMAAGSQIISQPTVAAVQTKAAARSNR